jgi:hypothetical protein
MIENKGVIINGRMVKCINDTGHRSDLEQQEMMMKLFGLKRKNKSIFGNEQVDFETKAEFDFGLFANGKLSIDSVTDDVEVKNLLKKGVNEYNQKKRGGVNTAQTIKNMPLKKEENESTITIQPASVELAEEVEAERKAKELIKTNSQNKEKTDGDLNKVMKIWDKHAIDISLRNIVQQYRNGLIEGIKQTKPDISDNYLQMVSNMFNHTFTDDSISKMVKELAAHPDIFKDVESIKKYLEESMVVNGLKEELHKLSLEMNVIVNAAPVGNAQQTAAAYTQSPQRKLISTYEDMESLVCQAFNPQTIPHYVEDTDKRKIINRLYNAFQNHEMALSITKMQVNPLFIMTDYYDGDNFTIQSLQYSNGGAISNMVIKFTSTGAIFNPAC